MVRFATNFSVRLTAAAIMTMTVASGCGSRAPSDGGSGPAVGKVEAAFNKAGGDYGIPVRFIIATAYLESRLTPQNATATYVSTNPTDQGKSPLGTPVTQTAFGVSYADLALDGAKPEASTLPTQIDAYGKWVAGNLKASGTTLNTNPQSQDERFQWVQALANMHRQGLSQRQNVRIIFAQELMQVLNQGFVWQDPSNAEKLNFDPEQDPLQVAKLLANNQQWFGLTQLDAEIEEASFLPLVTVPSDQLVNHPRRIEVIHCPLSLSACLELQSTEQNDNSDLPTKSSKKQIYLEAHYVIPADTSIFKQVIQVAKHSRVLTVTDPKGEPQFIGDAIVVMLVGNSGRLVDGVRMPAIPTWFENTQLLKMGDVINTVCTLLAQNDPTNVKRDTCMGTSGDLGVRFRQQDKSEESRWGDIPDFDASIFNAYVRNPGGIAQDTKFDFGGGNHQFNAGDDIPLTVQFAPAAKILQIERLARCADGHVVWEPIETDEVRSETTKTVTKQYHDSGPNQDGAQYFRALISDNTGQLMGWSIDQVMLSGFEAGKAYTSEKNCSAPL